MDKDEAIELLQKNDLTPTTEGNIASEYVEVGKIVLQSPPEGTYLEKQGEVALVVSSGKGVVEAVNGVSTVPYVVWDTQEDAISKLKLAGLVEPVIETKSDNTVEAGKVISQSVEAGKEVAEGTQITIIVSTGPEAFSMPNVVNKAKADAEKTLTTKGLVVSFTYEKNDSVAEGNVVGKTKDNATSTLEKQGFKVTVVENYSETVATGKVISQSPEGGSIAYAGDTISLVVSKGKETIYISSLGITGVPVSMNIGDAATLGYSYMPTSANSTSVTWSSSNTSVATISSSGVVKAIAPGSATIIVKATGSGVTATCAIKVNTPTISGLSDVKVFAGGGRQVTATTTPSGQAITWKTSNVDVVSFEGSSTKTSDGSMWIYGGAPGSATVTATITVGRTTVSETFTVTVPTPSITLSSYSGSGEQSTSSNKVITSGSSSSSSWEVFSTPYVGWKIDLPTTISSGIGGAVLCGWEVVSGEAKFNGTSLYIGQPGTVKVRYFCSNDAGTWYSSNYTYTLSLYKVTSDVNYIRSSTSTSSSKVGTIPRNTKVYISQVGYSGTIGQSGSRGWGKVTYNGVTGWISLFVWN